MGLDKTSAQPLFLQLEDLLRGLIDSGTFKPGDRIPSELELADMHAISRMTARRAVERLVMEGALFRQPGKGTFVAGPKVACRPPTALSFSRAMEALGLRVTTRILDRALVPAPPRVSRDLSIGAQSLVVMLRRLRFVEDKPMAIHVSYIPPRYLKDVSDEDLVHRRLNEVMEQAGGIRIVGSRDYVEATLVRAAEAGLLGTQTGAPMLLIRGVVYAEGNVPVRSTRSLFRGDRFRLFVAEYNLIEVRSSSLGLPGEIERQWLGPGAE